MKEIITLGIILFLIINAYISLKMVDAAVEKGYDKQKAENFMVCFLFPIIGHLYIIALPDRIAQKQNEEMLDLLAEIAYKEHEVIEKGEKP